MQNYSYSLSIAKKQTEGKERWTITNTDGQHADVGVISEAVEKLTLKSDISTIKPTRIVTLDESAVVFEALLRKSAVQGWKFKTGLMLVFPMAGFFLGVYIEQFFEWFLFGGSLLGFLAAAAAVALSKPTYDVTDGAGVGIGVVYKDVLRSLLLKQCVIETQYGRWRLAENSFSRIILGLTRTFGALCVAGVVMLYEDDKISGITGAVISFVAVVAGFVVIRLASVKTDKDGCSFALMNESGVQVGTTKEASGRYDIRVLDLRLDWRVAAAVGLIAVDYTTN